MFKSEASLFLSASTNVNSAKSLINKCKQIIVNFELSGNENAQSLKENINGCDIDSLVTKIENTKQSLMQLGSDFTAEYMTALTTALTTTSLDTSDMTEEQQMQYQMQYQMQMSSYEREYNEALLHMLEQHEESGQLTEEMQQQLEYQRQLVAQYDIQDQMSVLDPTSEEYIELFKTKSENDMALINSNPNLTDEQKQNYLSEYVSQYTYNIGKLSEARDTKLKNETLEQELMDLYAAKEENSGFWHPFVESEIDEAILDKKIELGIATEDEIEYKNMDGSDRFFADAEAFSTSTFAGLFNIVEGVGDAFVMAGSAVKVCDKEWASEYIARDISGEMYQGLVLSNDMNSYSAYGTWHDAGLIFGESVGKIGITFAAPWASGTLYGLNAMGQSAETAFNNGDDYWTALAKSTVAGVGGFAEGYGMSKLNLNMRQFASSGALKQAGKQIINNASSNIKSATFKTVLKNGFVSTINEADAWIETGCTFASNILEGVSSGDIDWKKTIKETGMVFATNLVMNSVTDLAFHVDASKPKVDASISADIDTPSTTVVDIDTTTTFDIDATDKLYDVEPTDKLFDVDATDKLFFDSKVTSTVDVDATVIKTINADDAVTTNIVATGNSLGKKYNNYNDILDHYDVKRQQFEASLTSREKTLFQNYCGEDWLASGNYKSVNGIARGNMIDYDLETITVRGTGGNTMTYTFSQFENQFGETVEAFVERQTKASLELNDALAKFSLDEDTMLYRGVNFDALQSYGITQGDSAETIFKKLTTAGDTYVDDGFMSTAVIPTGITDGKPIVFELNCKAGTTGALAESFNPYGENEFLLTGGQRFSIDGVESVNGQIIVHMTSIL